METMQSALLVTELDPTPVIVRWFILADMEDVMMIESESFEEPWNERDMKLTLQNKNCIGLVAEANGRVVGFMVLDMNPTAYEIIDIAVPILLRRRMIATQLINHLKGKLKKIPTSTSVNRTKIRARVGERNLAAHLFFRDQGFIATGIVASPFDNSDDSAYSFVWDIKKDALD